MWQTRQLSKGHKEKWKSPSTVASTLQNNFSKGFRVISITLLRNEQRKYESRHKNWNWVCNIYVVSVSIKWFIIASVCIKWVMIAHRKRTCYYLIIQRANLQTAGTHHQRNREDPQHNASNLSMKK